MVMMAVLPTSETLSQVWTKVANLTLLPERSIEQQNRIFIVDFELGLKNDTNGLVASGRVSKALSY